MLIEQSKHSLNLHTPICSGDLLLFHISIRSEHRCFQIRIYSGTPKILVLMKEFLLSGTRATALVCPRIDCVDLASTRSVFVFPFVDQSSGSLLEIFEPTEHFIKAKESTVIAPNSVKSRLYLRIGLLFRVGLRIRYCFRKGGGGLLGNAPAELINIFIDIQVLYIDWPFHALIQNSTKTICGRYFSTLLANVNILQTSDLICPSIISSKPILLLTYFRLCEFSVSKQQSLNAFFKCLELGCLNLSIRKIGIDKVQLPLMEIMPHWAAVAIAEAWLQISGTVIVDDSHQHDPAVSQLFTRAA